MLKHMPSAERRARAKPRADEGYQKILLHDIDWKTYKTIADALPNRRLRMTYDEGVLEIMTTSLTHDRFKSLFPLIVFALARFFRKKIATCGSFTHQREDLEKALEPDQSFYIANIAAVLGREKVDLTRDPPPDLEIEIDISRSSMNRLAIYAALKVPEVWVFDGRKLTVLLLRGDEYEESAASASFPEVPVSELRRFLALGIKEGDLEMIEALEQWLSSLASKETKKGKRPKGRSR